jgi:hypothetical protein
MSRRRLTKATEKQLAGIQDNLVQCMGAGHAWAVVGYKSYKLLLHCMRCDTKKVITKQGNKRSTQYIYPEGYKGWTKMGIDRWGMMVEAAMRAGDAE